MSLAFANEGGEVSLKEVIYFLTQFYVYDDNLSSSS